MKMASSSSGIGRILLALHYCVAVSMAAALDKSDSNHSDDSNNDDSHFLSGLPVGMFPVEFLLNQPYLCETRMFTLVFVHSATGNTAARMSIRKTWASIGQSRDSRTKVLFVVGIPPADRDVISSQIQNESETYRDLLQINVVDVYSNLTLKSVAMLDWVRRYCSDVQFVVKTDDDTFLNTPLLVSDLRNVVHKRFFMGDVIAAARPIRDRKSKYFTTAGEFSGKTYPTYLSGAAYVISGDIIPDLLAQAQSTELFWLEDVYVTGLLARRARARHVFNAKFGFRLQSLGPCQFKKLLALHRITPPEMLNAWKLLQKQQETC